MATLFWFTKHNKDKMLILVHREMNVLYVWLVSSKYMYRLQSYGKSPITSGSPLVEKSNFKTCKLSKLFTSMIRCIYVKHLKTNISLFKNVNR